MLIIDISAERSYKMGNICKNYDRIGFRVPTNHVQN